jgi:hypothetical protein
MKLTPENSDYMDSRPPTRGSNLSEAFRKEMTKRVAEARAAASRGASTGTTPHLKDIKNPQRDVADEP